MGKIDQRRARLSLAVLRVTLAEDRPLTGLMLARTEREPVGITLCCPSAAQTVDRPAGQRARELGDVGLLM